MIVANSDLQPSFFVTPSDFPGMDLMAFSKAFDRTVSVRAYLR